MVHISHKKAKSFNCEGYKLYGQFARIKYPDYLTGGDRLSTKHGG